MKDKTSIFKHSGAGTGFYGGPDRIGHRFQDSDQQAVDRNFYGDQ